MTWGYFGWGYIGLVLSWFGVRLVWGSVGMVFGWYGVGLVWGWAGMGLGWFGVRLARSFRWGYIILQPSKPYLKRTVI